MSDKIEFDFNWWGHNIIIMTPYKKLISDRNNEWTDGIFINGIYSNIKSPSDSANTDVKPNVK